MAQAPHVIWNNDEADRTGTPLVVMFHGYGSVSYTHLTLPTKA